MQPTPGSSDCQIHFCCPLPDITVGQTITTDPGTDAQVRVTPTPCGAQLDFSIPREQQMPPGTLFRPPARRSPCCLERIL